jgi:hypothetical protein
MTKETQANTNTNTNTLKSLTREQLEKRITLLERINRTAVNNADQYSKQVARIAALARAVRRSGVTLTDRIALVEAVEQIAAHAEVEATLDKDCIDWVCDCPPEEWDDMDLKLNSAPVVSTKH